MTRWTRKRLAFLSSFLVWTCATTVFGVGWWNARQTGLEQRELIESFEERNDAIAALLVSSNHGLTVIDDKGKVKEWNPFLEKLTGISKDEMLGQTLERVMEPEVWKKHDASYRTFFDQKNSAKLTVKINCRITDIEGSRIPVTVNACVVRPKKGGQKYAIAVIATEEQTINVN